MMNKRDYDKLATALRSSRPLVGGSVTKRGILHEQWEKDVKAIAHQLEQANPEYDAYTFCAMCGIFEIRR